MHVFTPKQDSGKLHVAKCRQIGILTALVISERLIQENILPFVEGGSVVPSATYNYMNYFQIGESRIQYLTCQRYQYRSLISFIRSQSYGHNFAGCYVWYLVVLSQLR